MDSKRELGHFLDEWMELVTESSGLSDTAW